MFKRLAKERNFRIEYSARNAHVHISKCYGKQINDLGSFPYTIVPLINIEVAIIPIRLNEGTAIRNWIIKNRFGDEKLFVINVRSTSFVPGNKSCRKVRNIYFPSVIEPVRRINIRFCHGA